MKHSENRAFAFFVVCMAILVFILASCGKPIKDVSAEMTSQYMMKYEHVGNGIWRGENLEVVCYSSRSLVCKWK